MDKKNKVVIIGLGSSGKIDKPITPQQSFYGRLKSRKEKKE